MGFLLVFFPEDNSPINPHKTNLFSSSSSSFSRTYSNLLLSKPHYSTISIFLCLLLLLTTTLLLFTLSTIEPSLPNNLRPSTSLSNNPFTSHYSASPALHRMGTLYRRGSRGMTDLVVGHVVDDTTHDEFKLFLRVMHRSGLTARADVVFIFASASLSSSFAPILHQENHSFFSLIHRYSQSQINFTNPKRSRNNYFDVTKFLNSGKKGMGEPLWGKRIRTNLTITNSETGESDSEDDVTTLHYGSVLSFDPDELDPENSLAGFLDHVPLSLRRWACYPMLLGRVKRVFKSVMLVDVKNIVVVNDPLGRVRNRSPESIFVYSKSDAERTQSRRRVNPGIIMGGARGIRRLSNAMVIEIVRAAMKTQQHKKKNSLSEPAIVSEVVGKELVLKKLNLMISTSESVVAEASSLGAATSLWDYQIIERGASDGDLINAFVKKHICWRAIDSSVYRDC